MIRKETDEQPVYSEQYQNTELKFYYGKIKTDFINHRKRLSFHLLAATVLYSMCQI